MQALVLSLSVLVAVSCRTPRPVAPSPIPRDLARRTFGEAEARCGADRGRLWGRSLCGPMLLVDRATRALVANRPAPSLARDGDVFVGTLPADQTIANSTLDWGGVRWTQIVWPPPADPDQRGVLLLHELFHRLAPEIGIAGGVPDGCAHLDELEGRYYLQLEWRALAAALVARDEELAGPLGDALAFRAARRRANAVAASCEDGLELAEGLAEYTGVVVGLDGAPQRIAAAIAGLKAHVGDPSFVRSFAYATGPAYGLLLDRTAPGWRSRIATARSLSALLPVAVGDGDAGRYEGPALRASEEARAERRAAEIARYRALLVDGPRLVLPLVHMKLEFDPRGVVPLGEHGSVYPTLRIVDDWGVLDVVGGALIAADFSSVSVPAPRTRTERARRDQWTLELARGWTLADGPRRGDYRPTATR